MVNLKETIYTIPINEAYDRDEECPICYLAKKLETESIEYALGAAMMEPDYRGESNEIGYCNKHFGDLFKIPNKLSLALVLDTHLNEINKKTAIFQKLSEKAVQGKKTSLFKKSDSSESLQEISKGLNNINSGCMVCNKINKTIDRYIDVMFYMWGHDAEFKHKFLSSKGVCLPHFEMLCNYALISPNKNNALEFINILCQKQQEEFARLNEEVHKFTLKFDYRNKDMDLGSAVDSPKRAIDKIGGYTD